MERIVENFPDSLSDKYLFIIKDVYILYQIRITFLSSSSNTFYNNYTIDRRNFQVIIFLFPVSDHRNFNCTFERSRLTRNSKK